MILFLQVAVILIVSRMMRGLFVAFKQPPVIGEMVAGLMLGPSLFGWLLPQWFAALFPPASVPSLNALSQIGMVLFMFTVGLRLRTESFGRKRGVVVVVSLTSIIAPFILGAVSAWVVHARLAPDGIPVVAFVLFVGAAMSMTAFPVLARILLDQNLFRTEVGRLTMACAAFDDVVGWMILAGVVTLVNVENVESASAIALRVGLLGVYVAVMALIVRPLLRWHAQRRGLSFGGEVNDLTTVLLVMLLSAVATEWLGVHALFGAFFAGLMMPQSQAFERACIERIQPITMALLLPLFFAFTGLRTSVTLINSADLWLDTAMFLAVAIVGKGVASAVAARLMGMSWRDASVVGTLLNTRGLIELVILSIGLDLGILTPVVFSMLVLMALVTTFMTSPLLSLIRPTHEPEAVAEVA